MKPENFKNYLYILATWMEAKLKAWDREFVTHLRCCSTSSTIIVIPMPRGWISMIQIFHFYVICFFVLFYFSVCLCSSSFFVGLAYRGKDIIAFRFIIEYISLMNFWPPSNSNRSIFKWGFLKDDILACVKIWD